jgi:hypothetical protein
MAAEGLVTGGGAAALLAVGQAERTFSDLHEVSRRKEKAPRKRGAFLFSLYRFRIPSPASNCANFVGAFWRGSGLFSGLITLVRRAKA